MKNTYDLKGIKDKVCLGECIDKKEAESLVFQPLDKLCFMAYQIQKRFFDNHFLLCSIYNGKCGRCSQDCKFCAQSMFYDTDIKAFDIIQDTVKITQEAKSNYAKGIKRFSIVNSGRGPTDEEIDVLCQSFDSINKDCDIMLCASVGLMNKQKLIKLRESGVKRIHCNLESSQNFFDNICTTHAFEERVCTIKNAIDVGLEVCSGGIFGLGEGWQDRLDLAFELKNLGVMSVPINFLKPIKGTPLENQPPLSMQDKQRIVAIFRFILPHATIITGAGRADMQDKGQALFLSGANGAISGDMLTVLGICTDDDISILDKLGYKLL